MKRTIAGKSGSIVLYGAAAFALVALAVAQAPRASADTAKTFRTECKETSRKKVCIGKKRCYWQITKRCRKVRI